MANRRTLFLGCTLSILFHLLVLWFFFDSRLIKFIDKSAPVQSDSLEVRIAPKERFLQEPDDVEPVPEAPSEPDIDQPKNPHPTLQTDQPETVDVGQKPNAVEEIDRDIEVSQQEKKQNNSQPFTGKEIVARDPETGGISDEMWGLNPRVLEKVQKARSARKERDKHRAAVDVLNRHLFSTSGQRESLKSGGGVHYERIGNGAVAHDFFRFLGAGQQECWMVTTLPSGKQNREPINCEELKSLGGVEASQLYVHPSLQTPGEKLKNLKLRKKTLDEQFIEKLAEERLPPMPELEPVQKPSIDLGPEVYNHVQKAAP